jgi:hypothetical protein
MTEALSEVAPAFVEMAHRIVWATAATIDTAGNPSTRILHPVWEWNGDALTGWIATSPLSTKAKHLAAVPRVSLTYWHPNHDTCTATCATTWELSEEQRREGGNGLPRHRRLLDTTLRSCLAGTRRKRRRSGSCESIRSRYG